MLDISVAFAQSGGMQIELIEQHCDQPSVYSELYERGERGLHHWCIFAENYDATIERDLDQGFVRGIDAVNEGVRFCYLDTTNPLGCMIEVVERSEIWTGVFRAVADAADRWDGKTDSVRDLPYRT